MRDNLRGQGKDVSKCSLNLDSDGTLTFQSVPWAVASWHLQVGSCKLAVASGQLQVGSCKLAAASGQLQVGSCKWAVASGQLQVGQLWMLLLSPRLSG
jgi:hypothetical protein